VKAPTSDFDWSPDVVRNLGIVTLVDRAPAFAAVRSSLMTQPDESHDQAV
jgi:hypothetical protein